jgi:hypothetical protein
MARPKQSNRAIITVKIIRQGCWRFNFTLISRQKDAQIEKSALRGERANRREKKERD